MLFTEGRLLELSLYGRSFPLGVGGGPLEK